ncbi:LacI family DNA-binding transcriptional regulator [Streptomyces sp. NPDC056486]|uniref:LacI family DNA-binding transcriptional regulator n=1 Tax=Streptomyces sp. NPDC056486 TaxID=3345835 RepID=UPI00367A2275
MASTDVTIYQVAEAAGVSISTVSLALNHPDRVSPKTRDRIIRVAGELGYRSGATTSERARRRSGRIAVLAPFSSYETYRTRLVGILEAFGPHNVEVVVHDTPSATESASPLLETMPVRGDVDGLLIMGVPLGEEGADRLHRWGPPTVLVDSLNAEFTSVTFDDEQAGYLLATHLLGRGHRSLAYLHEPYRASAYTSAGRLRLDGMARAIREAGGAEPEIEDIALAGNDVASARAHAAEFARRAERPTAVIAHHDLLAAGFLSGLRAAGTRTPDEVAVAGFDDGPLAEVLGLTTVRQPFAESGRRAAELLRSLIENPQQTPLRTLLVPQLITRETT